MTVTDGRARPFDDAQASIVAVKTSHPRRVVRSLEQFVRAYPDTAANDRACVEAALQYAPCVCVIPLGSRGT